VTPQLPESCRDSLSKRTTDARWRTLLAYLGVLFMPLTHTLTAILPSTNLDASQAFYARLGFTVQTDYPPNYRILSDGKGASLHLTTAPEGWLIRGRNLFGLYLYTEDVDRLAAEFGRSVIHPPENKPWGMYEFALSDPDDALVRVGRPTQK
jgi:hypothetical protein